jgi:hypothetical protein
MGAVEEQPDAAVRCLQDVPIGVFIIPGRIEFACISEWAY